MPALQSIVFSLFANSATGDLEARGIAYTNGEARLRSVDLTTDGGGTWQAAVVEDDGQGSGGESSRYAWSRWRATLNAPRGGVGNGVTVFSRATDTEGKVQPRVSRQEHGYIYNGWGKAVL